MKELEYYIYSLNFTDSVYGLEYYPYACTKGYADSIYKRVERVKITREEYEKFCRLHGSDDDTAVRMGQTLMKKRFYER